MSSVTTKRKRRQTQLDTLRYMNVCTGLPLAAGLLYPFTHQRLPPELAGLASIPPPFHPTNSAYPVTYTSTSHTRA